MPPEKPIEQETLRVSIEPDEDGFLSERIDIAVRRWAREHPNLSIVSRQYRHGENTVVVILRFQAKEVP
jgi:hypothetical protein